MFQTAREIFVAGGPVMVPLAVLSVLSLSLVFERVLFFIGASGRSATADRIAGSMVDTARAEAAAAAGGSVYHTFAAALLALRGETPDPEARALRALERVRPRVERFMGTLSTIIAAAPLLGILGTVTGIIESFGLLGRAETVTDPAELASGISQALYTTAFGLSIALVTVFPYAIFRARGQRVLGMLEVIAASEGAGEGASGGASGGASVTE